MKFKEARKVFLFLILAIALAIFYWHKGMPLPLSLEFQRFIWNNKLSGLVVAIKNQQGDVDYWVYGERAEVKTLPLTQQSPMVMASLSKPITGMTIRWLVGKGMLNLDSKLVDLLPELDFSKDKRFEELTVSDLLQHTAGFDRRVSGDGLYVDGSFRTCREVASRALAHGVDFEPGSRIQYSNVGYCFLALVIENVNQKSYEDTVWEMLEEKKIPPEKLYWGMKAEERAEWNLRASMSSGDLQKITPVGGWVSNVDTLLAIYALEAVDRQLIARAPQCVVAGDAYYGLGWKILPQGEDFILRHYGEFLPVYYSFALMLPNGVQVVGFAEGEMNHYEGKFNELTKMLTERLM